MVRMTVLFTIITLALMFFLAMFITFIYSLYAAWALTILWGWFIVPFFHQPSLDYRIAVGLFIILGFLRSWNWQPDPTDPAEQNAKRISAALYLFFGPILVLLVGYLAHTFLH